MTAEDRVLVRRRLEVRRLIGGGYVKLPAEPEYRPEGEHTIIVAFRDSHGPYRALATTPDGRTWLVS